MSTRFEGPVGYATAAEAPSGELDKIGGRLSVINKCLWEKVSQVGNVADSVFGAIPQALNKDTPPDKPNCKMASLDMVISEIDNAISALGSQINRIDRF